jgi:hypothetical protein
VQKTRQYKNLKPGSDSIRTDQALGRNVGQPYRVLADQVAGHEAERRPGAGEEWLAAAKHDVVELEPILINETKIGQASCQVGSANFKLPGEPSLQPAYHGLNVVSDKRGIGAN